MKQMFGYNGVESVNFFRISG